MCLIFKGRINMWPFSKSVLTAINQHSMMTCYSSYTCGVLSLMSYEGHDLCNHIHVHSSNEGPLKYCTLVNKSSLPCTLALLDPIGSQYIRDIPCLFICLSVCLFVRSISKIYTLYPTLQYTTLQHYNTTLQHYNTTKLQH